MPLAEPIVTDEEAVLHVPPGEASVKVTVEPTHTFDGTRMFAGKGLTVTNLVT